jgi:hypothetical protein
VADAYAPIPQAAGTRCTLAETMGATVHGWGELLVRPRNFAIVALLAFVAACARAPVPVTVCGMHLGETVTFTGEYITDSLERFWVRPNGCECGIPLGQRAAEGDDLLDRAVDDTKPKRRIEAVFGGRDRRIEAAGLFSVEPRQDRE